MLSGKVANALHSQALLRALMTQQIPEAEGTAMMADAASTS